MKKKSLYLIMFGTLTCLLVLADLPQSIVNRGLNSAYANVTTNAGRNHIWKTGFFKSDKPGTTWTSGRLWTMGPKYPKHPEYPKRRKYPVPEPSTIAFIGTGAVAGAGIYLFLKYKNRKK